MQLAPDGVVHERVLRFVVGVFARLGRVCLERLVNAHVGRQHLVVDEELDLWH